MVGGRRTPTCSSRRAEATHGARGSCWTKDDRAFSAVLGLTDPQRLPPRIEQHITPAQVKDFACKHPCLAQEREDQPVGWRRAGDRDIQRMLFVLLADRSRQGPPATQWRQLCQRPPRTQAVADRPREQVPERGDAPPDGTGGCFAANDPGLEMPMI